MTGLAAENVQARLRMGALMALSNSGGPMLLTTGNKSEMCVGYATLYGDMAGGYSVLKDADKPPSSNLRVGATGTGLKAPWRRRPRDARASDCQTTHR